MKLVSAICFETGGKSVGPKCISLLSNSAIRADSKIKIKASSKNKEAIWIGGRDDITAGTNDAVDGYPLFPGDDVELYVRNPNEVFVRSTRYKNQKIWWMVV